MSSIFLLLPILLPIIGGLALWISNTASDRTRRIVIGAVVLVNTAIVWALILNCKEEAVVLFRFTRNMPVELQFDGLGRFFAALVSVLWALTTFYSFEYMEKTVHRTVFYPFFLMAYGVTLGIAMSGNMLTMYCFYELLTLTTVPLVIHTMTKPAVRAARMYLVFSIGGAAFAFVAMVFLMANGFSLDYVFGGTVTAVGNKNTYLLIYVLAFLGFGVKAAIFPLYKWLPAASVAPTPVTALLHAVAVVKSSAFAIIRLTWYAFSVDFLRGTWAQTVVLCIAMFTILFGSAMALKQTHFKLRLAYSTVSNLSYIIFGAVLMTPAGLAAGMQHMLFHSFIKITAFFCAGAVLHTNHIEYIRDLNGIGRKMPVTFACFTVSALALTGIPPLNGFISKWGLLTSAAGTGTPLGIAGVAVIIISALLTAIYMFSIVVRAYFPPKGEDLRRLDGVHEAGGLMCVPMGLLSVCCIAMGIFASPIVQITESIARGLF
jgi:multicomponent Na+:H+ antiporter subunit D